MAASKEEIRDIATEVINTALSKNPGLAVPREVCDLRHSYITDQLAEMKKSVDGIKKAGWAVAVAICLNVVYTMISHITK